MENNQVGNGCCEHEKQNGRLGRMGRGRTVNLFSKKMLDYFNEKGLRVIDTLGRLEKILCD